MLRQCKPSQCASCAAAPRQLGVRTDGYDHLVALAGNPNTGKSTVFNALTGLKQHTGNWPGKTVLRAEGAFAHGGKRFKLIDLPGTYSLLSASTDEQVARDFLLFGEPGCVIVVIDATCIERNLNLVFQVMEITPRVVVCANLMDEAQRKGIAVDVERLGELLGVPVVATAARRHRGLNELMQVIDEVTAGRITPRPIVPDTPDELKQAVDAVTPLVRTLAPQLPNTRWIAYRLIEGDHRIREALLSGELGDSQPHASPGDVLDRIDEIRDSVGEQFRDVIVTQAYQQAERIARQVVRHESRRATIDERLDRALTHPVGGWPAMLLILAAVFWITVTGANVPSQLLAGVLMNEGGLSGFFTEHLHMQAPAFATRSIYEWLHIGFDAAGAPWWLSGSLIDGVYLCLAWVVSVMLPPMAIFFPLFTLLEDLGYLPRVAFNLDPLFRRAGAHGKQALTMSMGFGCNAAGVIACRIIDSPREKLIAILTNNFMICNGRFPTVIAIATLMAAAQITSPALVATVAAGAVIGVVLLGIAIMFIVSYALSRTVLRGEASAFTLELPPYRRPAVLRVLYMSIIDRTIFVLARACAVAAPAGLVIWLVAHVNVAGAPIAQHLVVMLEPIGWVMGLSGVIVLAYIIAIPANEIVVPTIIMLLILVGGDMGLGLETGRMVEPDGDALATILAANGWTTLTGVCLLLFVLLHNPCGTTIWTMWRETRSVRWTLFGALMPLALGVIVCMLIAGVWRLFI
jgi:ferrous iron transport protein B